MMLTPQKLPDPSAPFRRVLEEDENLLARAERNGPTQTPPDQRPTSPARKWPEPLASQAFHGIAGELVRIIEPHTEADSAALLLQTLVAFGSIAGRGAYFRVGGDRHTTNLFCMLVGATAAGRKGSGWSCVRHVFERVEPAWAAERVLTGLSSGEGLIWSVRDPIEKQQPVREKGRVVEYQTVIEDHGITDKRLLVIETEFASSLKVMGREGSTLSPVIRQSWDSGHLRVLTKNSPATSTGAHISIIAHITRDELLRLLSATDTVNGFANRFLWVCSRRSKLLPDGGGLQDENFGPIVERLQEASRFAQSAGEIQRNAEAGVIWQTVYGTLSDGRMGFFGSATSRAEAQVLRLSLLYALLDSSREVRREHLLAALAIWKYAEDSARYVFGDAVGNPVADRVRAALRSAALGLTRTEIRDLFDRNRSAAEIDAALACLEEYGLASRVTVKTGGRPGERWYAVC